MKLKDKLREQLKARMHEAGQRKQRSGGGVLTGKDVQFFLPKAGDWVVDIIPYIAGQNGPVDMQGRPKNPPGEVAYVMEYWQHSNIGMDQRGRCVCLAKTFNKKCPVCEHRLKLLEMKLEEQGNEKLIEQLKPKLRAAYNIICYTGDEESKGIQVWTLSWYYSEDVFQALAKRKARSARVGSKTGSPYVYFMDLEEGKSISFTQTDRDEMYELVGVGFEDRDYKLDESLVEKAYCLEDLLTNSFPKADGVILWDELYKSIYEYYWGTPFELERGGIAVAVEEEGGVEEEEETEGVEEEEETEGVEEEEETEEEEEEEKTEEEEEEEGPVRKPFKTNTKPKPSKTNTKSFKSPNKASKASPHEEKWEEMSKRQMLKALGKYPELASKLDVDLDEITEEELFFSIQDALSES